MAESIKCSCKWKSCKRHGHCDECIEHHKNHPKYPIPFCKKQKSQTLPSKKTDK